jgi:hypothetical protein
MRRFVIAFVVMSSWPLVLRAQELSLERISIALQQPAPVFGTTPAPTNPPSVLRKLGPLTFVQPELRGEFVRVLLPVGELISRVVDRIGTAAIRRQEAAARREVDAALKAFFDAQSHPEP